MGKDLVGAGNGDGIDHEGQEVGDVGLHKLGVELEQEHHDEGALGDNLEGAGAGVELARPRGGGAVEASPNAAASTAAAVIPEADAVGVGGGGGGGEMGLRAGEEVGDGVGEVVVDGDDEVEEGLDLGLDGGAEVAEEVEDDADGDEGVVLVVLGEDVEGELEEVLDEGTEDLRVREAVEDLHHHVAQLVLDVLLELGLRQMRQDRRERPEVALEEVEVLRRVRDLQAVPHLHHHLQPHLHREVWLHEALGVLLVVEDGRH